MGLAYIHRNQSTVQTLSTATATATATLKFNPNTPKTTFFASDISPGWFTLLLAQNIYVNHSRDAARKAARMYLKEFRIV